MSEPSSLSSRGVQLGLLGSFSLRIDCEPVRLPMNAQRLVSFLAVSDGLLLRRHVAGSLWGNKSERRAAGSLRSALWRLGNPTYPLVEAKDVHLRLSPAVSVDLRASESLANRIIAGAHDLDGAELDETLLARDLLPDWTEDWVLIRREYHAQLRLRALEALCRKLQEMGRFGQAVQVGILVVAAEPLRESAQRALISAHLADGNLAAALERYDSFRELLRDDLGLEPSPRMQALVERLHR